MNNFLLIIFGNFKNPSVAQDIAINLTPIVDSEYLKFISSKFYMTANFISDIPREEIDEYLKVALQSIEVDYFLVEIHDNLSVNFPKEIVSHLFNLEVPSGISFVGIDTSQIHMKTVNQNTDNTEDIASLLFDKIKQNIAQPTLDQLLDKIKNKGMKSLSPYELGVLENYSK